MNKKTPIAYGTGLIALDLVMNSTSHSSVHSWTGGTCGNVMAILSYLGWNSYPIARLNGDPASRIVKADLGRWGVKLDFASCTPTGDTPIIIQEILKKKNGEPIHRFGWSCPHCGNWLPSFKPVTLQSAEPIAQKMKDPSVFFMDRLFPSAIKLAKSAKEKGALVVFEPSARLEPRLLAEALKIAHVIKYSEERFKEIIPTSVSEGSILLEIQTLGKRGLRYKNNATKKKSEWKYLQAYSVPHVVDTCGSGDWCTAGLISKIGRAGANEFQKISDDFLNESFQFGQALSAWNCCFEGARGGMYSVSKEIFQSQVKEILKGTSAKLEVLNAIEKKSEKSVLCPACPPRTRTKRIVISRRKISAPNNS